MKSTALDVASAVVIALITAGVLVLALSSCATTVERERQYFVCQPTGGALLCVELHEDELAPSPPPTEPTSAPPDDTSREVAL